MRVDARQPIAKYITCTLDGVDVTEQTTDACEGERGWIERYARDENGRILLGIDEEGRRTPRYEMAYGHVVLSLRHGAPPPAVRLYAALREYEAAMGSA